MKICTTCKENLPESSFSKKRQRKDGLSGICRNCIRAVSKRNYARYRDELIQKSRDFRAQNPDSFKQYYRDNYDYFQDYNAKTAEKRAQWQKENKARIDQKRRERWEKRPELRLKARIRSYFWSKLKKSYVAKPNSSIALLGCSVEEFKRHLEKRFASGMSWENYGKWHLDHIRPCAAFDLTNPIQLAACFHFSNLQPLWAKDNLRKGAKV